MPRLVGGELRFTLEDRKAQVGPVLEQPVWGGEDDPATDEREVDNVRSCHYAAVLATRRTLRSP